MVAALHSALPCMLLSERRCGSFCGVCVQAGQLMVACTAEVVCARIEHSALLALAHWLVACAAFPSRPARHLHSRRQGSFGTS